MCASVCVCVRVFFPYENNIRNVKLLWSAKCRSERRMKWCGEEETRLMRQATYLGPRRSSAWTLVVMFWWAIGMTETKRETIWRGCTRSDDCHALSNWSYGWRNAWGKCLCMKSTSCNPASMDSLREPGKFDCAIGFEGEKRKDVGMMIRRHARCIHNHWEWLEGCMCWHSLLSGLLLYWLVGVDVVSLVMQIKL